MKRRIRCSSVERMYLPEIATTCVSDIALEKQCYRDNSQMYIFVVCMRNAHAEFFMGICGAGYSTGSCPAEMQGP